jgi:hypothetical protein
VIEKLFKLNVQGTCKYDAEYFGDANSEPDRAENVKLLSQFLAELVNAALR